MYRNKLFATGTALSLGVVALIVVIVLQTGTAYAVPIAGAGGFTVEADEIRAYDAHLYTGVDDTSRTEATPMTVTETERAEIDGLRLTKQLPVESLPGLSGQARVVITASGTSTAEDMLMKTTRLHGETVVARGQVIDESPASDPRERFTIDAPGDPDQGKTVDPSADGSGPGLIMRNATGRAHYMATSRITVPGQEITIEYDPDGDGTYQHTYGE